MKAIILLYNNMYFNNLSEKYLRVNDNRRCSAAHGGCALIQLVPEPAE
jgi:hypothetical protein